MPRKAAGLTALKVKSAKPGRYGDGGGLYLLVRGEDSRFWLFRYTPKGGKMREMGLGRAGAGQGTVTLAEAREQAARLFALVRAGIDPLVKRVADEAEARARVQDARVRAISFTKASADYIAANKAGWSNPKHAAQWASTLKTYADPHLGDVAVADVATAHVLATLEPLWSTKPETATRLRGRIEAILDYGKARGWREGENPARWKGHLALMLPARRKVAAVEHHAALPWREVGAFMEALQGQAGVAALALRFAILTAARTGEVTGATWGEVDMPGKVWAIPAARMKGRREHRVPLSPPVLELLAEVAKLRREANNPAAPVFPGASPAKGLSNMAMLLLLRRMKRTDVTAHGFRSAFRDWAAEATAYPAEVAEMALAHAVGNAVEAAYRRGDLLEKRVRLMADWGTFCGKVPEAKGENVTPLRAAS